MSFFPNFQQNNLFQAPMSINDFEVMKVLGAGQHGSVSKVKYIKTGMIFALKSITQSYFKSEEREIDFLREKQILYDLTAKNFVHVIKLYADFQDYNNRYLVMELADGTYLNDLKGNNPNGYVDQKLVINILMQLLETLVYLHDNCHIIHRDIKPDNIILERNGNIKLLDFGLSAYLVNQNQQLVSNRSLKGALNFVPTEIIFSQLPLNYDYKIDVFALGFTIYSLMNPSQGKNYNLPLITVGKYGKDNLKRFENNIINNFYDPWLINFVERLYENNKSKRPTAAEALNLLKQLLSKPNPNNFMGIPNKKTDISNVNVPFNRQITKPIENNSNIILSNNNINNQIYKNVQNNMPKSQVINQFNNMNRINNPVNNSNFGRNDSAISTSSTNVEEFLRPTMGKENRIKSSMKCILYILYKLDKMNFIRAQFQSILNNCQTNYSQYIIFSFYQILKSLQQLESGQINLAAYEQAVNNFTTHIFNNNNSGISGTRPMILFYMIAHCLKDEFNQYFNNIYQNNMYDYIIQNNYFILKDLVPLNNQNVYNLISTKILSFKDKFRGPFVDNFYFLMLLLSKCPQCGSLFGISEFEVAQFLPLDVPNPENNIQDLINNYFAPKILAGNNNCKNCKCQGKKLRQRYCLNLPNYLFLELEDKNRIFFNDKIGISLFNGQMCYYQFYSCIYKRRINDLLSFSAILKVQNAYFHYSNDKVEYWNANNLNIENPSLAVYKIISS